MRKRIYLSLTSRLLILSFVITLLITELSLLLPNNRKYDRAAHITRNQVDAFAEEENLSLSARKRLELLVESIYSQVIPSKWVRFLEGLFIAFTVNILLNILVWKKIIAPARKVFEEQKILLEKLRESRKKARQGSVVVLKEVKF